MRKLLWFFTFISVLSPSLAQPYYSLQGKVTFQNSGHKPVVNARVLSHGANPTTTTSSGSFILTYVSRQPGDTLGLTIAFTQEEGDSIVTYEVVNAEELKRLLPSPDSRDTAKFYLCRLGEWDLNARKYYKITLATIEESYQQRKAQLEARYGTSLSQQRLLYGEIEILNLEYEDVKKWAVGMSEEFAKVNLDDMNETYREAFNLFTRGEVDSAILVLEAADLGKVLEAFNLEKLRLFRLGDSIKSRQKDLDLAVHTYVKSAELLGKVQHQQGASLDSALESYALAIRIDSSRLESWLGYGNLLLAKYHEIPPDSIGMAGSLYGATYELLQDTTLAVASWLWYSRALHMHLNPAEGWAVPPEHFMQAHATAAFAMALAYYKAPEVMPYERALAKCQDVLAWAGGQNTGPGQSHLYTLIQGLAKALEQGK